MHHPFFIRSLGSSFAMLFIAVPAILAQEMVNHASVSGRVTDPANGVLQGAEVTARHTETNSQPYGQDRSRRTFSIPVPGRRPI